LQQATENYVTTAKVDGTKLTQIGKSPKLGHENETVQSARFVGNRAYVVTFEQTDPLIVVDLVNPATPTVLGEIEIPGFSYYMHPIDENHLITAGVSGTRSAQLQLFDVTDPKNIPKPKVLDFGAGSSSTLQYDHKAITFFDGYLALPVYSYGYDARYAYSSGLQVVKVDLEKGPQSVAMIDHARLYANNGAGVSCGRCDAVSCYEYSCADYYNPEVRRGHFVQGDGKTYVYSFSYAGVLVHDLASPQRAVASVGLPQPQFTQNGPWYAADGAPTVPSTTPPSSGSGRVRDAGVATSVAVP
jgi:hypothetical protein